jgi:hypothetical protein
MGHFFLQLLLGLLWVVSEVLFEGIAEGLMDLVFRGIARFFDGTDLENPTVAAIVYMLLGSFVGGLSLILFPHPIVHPSRLHGISLVIAPVLTGLLMSGVGSMLRSRGKKVIQLESFGYGFTFAFGMALVRFLFAK